MKIKENEKILATFYPNGKFYYLLKKKMIKIINKRIEENFKNQREFYNLINSKTEKEIIKFYDYVGFNHPIKKKKLSTKINSYINHNRKSGQTRKEILSFLSSKAHKTSELTIALKIGSSCLSHHLKMLINEELINKVPGKLERNNKGRIIHVEEDKWTIKR